MPSVLDFNSILYIILVGAAAFTAFFTYRAAKATKDAAQAQLLYKFLDEYRSSEMFDSLYALRKWRDNEEVSFSSYEHLLLKDENTIKKINHARRHVKSHFFKALALHESGLAGIDFMKSICEPSGMSVLFDIVEPMEESLAKYIKTKQDENLPDELRGSITEEKLIRYRKKLEDDSELLFRDKPYIHILIRELEPNFRHKFNKLRKIRDSFAEEGSTVDNKYLSL